MGKKGNNRNLVHNNKDKVSKTTKKVTVLNSTPYKPKPKAFTRKVTDANQGIILIDQEATEALYTKSGKNAVGNEFQVHYWSLVFRYEADDGSILDIAIPTTYFNYLQEVTGAHIDFDLKDVDDMSTKVIPIHNMKVNELMASGIQERLEESLGIKFTKVISVNLNSIHRHPGGSARQSFSGTDYREDMDDLGVVFPLHTAEDNKPNFAGIMAVDYNTCKTAHYEYRVANGELGKDLEYVQGRCIALVRKKQIEDKRSKVERLMGYGGPDRFDYRANKCSKNELHDEILRIFDSINFEPSTDLVLEENVTKKASTTNYYSNKYGYNYNAAKKDLASNKGTKHVQTSIGFSKKTTALNKDEISEARATLKKYATYKSRTKEELNAIGYTLLCNQADMLHAMFYAEQRKDVGFIKSKYEVIKEIIDLQEYIDADIDGAKYVLGLVKEEDKPEQPSQEEIMKSKELLNVLQNYQPRTKEQLETLIIASLRGYETMLYRLVNGKTRIDNNDQLDPEKASDKDFLIKEVIDLQRDLAVMIEEAKKRIAASMEPVIEDVPTEEDTVLEVNFKSDTEIKNMGYMQLVEYAEYLDKTFYGEDSEYIVPVKLVDIIDDIHRLQEDIQAELEDLMEDMSNPEDVQQHSQR
jgi:hypothetical protein